MLLLRHSVKKGMWVEGFAAGKGQGVRREGIATEVGQLLGAPGQGPFVSCADVLAKAALLLGQRWTAGTDNRKTEVGQLPWLPAGTLQAVLTSCARRGALLAETI